MLSRITIILLLSLFTKPLFADHLPGGSITYTCLGGNFFEVKLSLMRECTGSPMIPQSLHFSNSCGVVFDLGDLAPVQVEYPQQICAANAPNGSCAGGTFPDFQLFEFTTEVYLSPCAFWTISWFTCCRQTTVNVQSTPGLYIETQIDNIADSCNSSPVFNFNGVPRVCLGQPVNYDAGATDPDGDRMVYSLIDARFASPSPVSVNYIFPNYGGEPLAGLSLDDQGQITFTPTQQGLVIVAVQVDEYDTNNVWIGSVMRDFTFLVAPCDNILPAASAGTITSTSGSANPTTERSFEMCVGSDACATIEFTDADQGQALSIWTNVATILPGASIETTGTNPLTLTLCWLDIDHEPGDHTFVVTVSDNACAVYGARSFVYTVAINEISAGIGNAIEVCPQAEPFTMLDSLLGEPLIGGDWTTPDGNAHSGTFVGSVDLAGTYEYEVSNGACSAAAQLVISFLPETDSACISISVPELDLHPITVSPNPTSGSLTIESNGPLQPHLGIFDPQGRYVGTVFITSNSSRSELDLPGDLLNGIYYLRGSFRSGQPFLVRTVLYR